MRHFTILGLSCGLILALVGSAQAQLGAMRASEKTFELDGRDRSFLVFAPRGVTEPMPCVLVLHGGGGNARQMERYTRFNVLAQQEKFLVCYPQGFQKNWNDGRGAENIPAQQHKIDDMKYFRQVVERIGKEYPLDRSRVFSTGISNGAIMSHRLAAEASDLFAGIAPLVGGMAEPVAATFRPSHPVSLFVIQGDSDPLVPFAGGAVGYRIGRKRGTLISTHDAVAKYVKANEITGKPDVRQLPDKDPSDGTRTEATIYPPSKQGARVQLYVVKQGGHGWPGRPAYANERLIGKVSQDFDATTEIWNFFKTCPARKP